MSCIAHQASQSLEFSRQEYWSGLPFPSPGTEPGSPIAGRFLSVWVIREAQLLSYYLNSWLFQSQKKAQNKCMERYSKYTNENEVLHLFLTFKMYENYKEQFSHSFFFLIFIFTLFYFTILYWFRHTLTWIHHGCTWVSKHEPPSHLPPHIISLDHPRAPAPSIRYPASNIDWRFVSYMIVYMFQCHSPESSHTLPLPQSPKVHSTHLCLFCCLAYRVIITIFLNSTYMC